MRILFWNIRGFDRRGGRTLLKDFLRKHKIDVVCLQEMIKQDFTDTELRSLDIGDKFYWCWLPVSGHSGGMLLGLWDSVFEVDHVDKGQAFLSAAAVHRSSGRPLEVLAVYGPADHGISEAFLEELTQKITSCSLQM